MSQPETTDHDVVVIGGGPAGENAADYAARGGLDVVVVEAELLGGECSYWACMPSKALLTPLDVAAQAGHLGGLATPALDRDALLARRDSFTSGWDDEGQVDWARSAGLSIVRGRGRLTGEREVTVGDRVLRARRAVVVATGSEAVVPEVYADVAPWTSRDATGIHEVPATIAVVGGGVVACEAARWLAALGAEVTMLVRDDRLLARAEEAAAEIVATSLRGAGITVRLGVEVGSAHRDPPLTTAVGHPRGTEVTLVVDGAQERYAEVLVATGRRPALRDLGLGSVGVTVPERGGLAPENLPDWLQVVGDASDGAPLTHWASTRPGSSAPGSPGHRCASPTRSPCRRSSSPTRRSRGWGAPARRRPTPGCWTPTCRPSPVPRCSATTSPGGRASSSRTTASSVRPSSDRTPASCCTRPPSRSSAGCR